MAFTLDATVGGPSANSYVTVEQADDYFEAHLDGDAWADASAEQKRAALVMATNRIDCETFDGVRETSTQSLRWPRRYTTADSAQIPRNVEHAVCEQALHYIKVINGDYTIDENDLETLSSINLAGAIQATIKPNVKADRLPTRVKQLLKALGEGVWLNGSQLRYIR